MYALERRIRAVAMVALVTGSTLTASACAISQQQELQLGQQYAAQLNEELPIIDDAAATRYINALGNEIAAQGERNLNYRFYLVNTDVVNAFAVPGGYVYVNRGLVEAADNLSELAGVMAHEIAHVEKRHSVEQLERVQAANMGLTLAYVLLGRAPSGVEETAINVGGSLVFANYSRSAEEEADATAVELLLAAGIDPNGLVTFFEELLEQRSRSPSQLEQWFSTHPTTEDRIANTRALIQQVPQSRLRGLQTNSEAFQRFKRTLSQYPAPRSN